MVVEGSFPLMGVKVTHDKESSTQEYDLYINPQRPTFGLYVRTGAGLPDLADSGQWVIESTLAGSELSHDLVQRLGKKVLSPVSITR